MNQDIRKIAKWARSQGWTVKDDAKGYTHFYDRDGNHAKRAKDEQNDEGRNGRDE